MFLRWPNDLSIYCIQYCSRRARDGLLLPLFISVGFFHRVNYLSGLWRAVSSATNTLLITHIEIYISISAFNNRLKTLHTRKTPNDPCARYHFCMYAACRLLTTRGVDVHAPVHDFWFNVLIRHPANTRQFGLNPALSTA